MAARLIGRSGSVQDFVGRDAGGCDASADDHGHEEAHMVAGSEPSPMYSLACFTCASSE